MPTRLPAFLQILDCGATDRTEALENQHTNTPANAQRVDRLAPRARGESIARRLNGLDVSPGVGQEDFDAFGEPELS